MAFRKKPSSEQTSAIRVKKGIESNPRFIRTYRSPILFSVEMSRGVLVDDPQVVLQRRLELAFGDVLLGGAKEFVACHVEEILTRIRARSSVSIPRT
jgi:hypothetical protein